MNQHTRVWKMQRWILGLALVAALLPGAAVAQQEAQYSQYMFNTLFINPAYAGSREQGSMSLIGRNQWTGFPGAPRSGAFALHSPSANLRNGYGFMLTADGIGPVATMGLSGQYAYRIKFDDDHTLSLGLQGGVDYYSTNFGGLRLEDQTDNSFAGQDIRRLLPNAGAGAYFNGKVGYVGIAVPRLIQNRLSPTEADTVARQRRHAFLTGGFLVNLGPNLKLRPSTLVKYAGPGTLNVDINASLLFKERIWLGASWRSEDAVVVMAEFWATPQLRLGYAYDFTTSALRNYSTGSHELSIGYDFNFKKGKVVSPRYF